MNRRVGYLMESQSRNSRRSGPKPKRTISSTNSKEGVEMCD